MPRVHYSFLIVILLRMPEAFAQKPLALHTGAIALNLPGLNVSLARIDLVITATAAPSNLPGNLLCAVAHLLDSNASLGAITNLLNQILGAIRL
jgi:hypothetical protein